MVCKDMDLLSMDYFRDLSQSWDNRQGKSSYFRHRELPWKHNLSWAQEDLRRSKAKLAEFSVQKVGGENLVLPVLHQEFQEHAALLDFIKTCGTQKNLPKGSRIHASVVKSGLLEKDIYVGTALLRMYANCGALAKAQVVFDELPTRDVASWNALIAGYAQHGLGYEALNCLEQMQDEHLSPNAVTFLCIVKACSSIGATQKGVEMHTEINRQGLLEKSNVLGNALVDMYCKFGALANAQKVFDKLPARDVVSWTSLIAGYARHGRSDKALNCFDRMQDEGLSPNAATFICILKACGCIGAIEKGERIHAEVSRQGLLEKHLGLGTAIVDMYAKCGVLAKAQVVFDELPAYDVICWTALIAGYAQHGLGDEALNYFGRMRDEGFSPDAATYVCALKACGSIGAAERGEEIHAEVSRQGLLEEHIVLGNALVDMYCKCGRLVKAQEVFDELPIRDVASWNALMAGFVQHGFGDEALNCFGRMRDEGLSPDAVTFLCILKACSSIGATEKGEEIHVEVSRQGLLKNSTALGSALVDMYAKCGRLAKAQEVFDELPRGDVFSWTALLAGYAQLGKARQLFESFSEMIKERIEPNVVTFVVLLTACSHAGLLEEGQMYFGTMNTVYHIIPNLEHHICMVDLFSRAGHFDEATSVIEKMPLSECLFAWSALFGACQSVEFGKWVFEHAVKADEKYAAAYVYMGNIYAAAGMKEEAG